MGMECLRFWYPSEFEYKVNDQWAGTQPLRADNSPGCVVRTARGLLEFSGSYLTMLGHEQT